MRVWPPPVGGRPAGGPPLPPEPHLLTKAAWSDIALGVVITLGSSLIGGLGVIVMPILYFVLRPTSPAFARGIGYGLLLTLGAFALCSYAIVHQHP